MHIRSGGEVDIGCADFSIFHNLVELQPSPDSLPVCSVSYAEPFVLMSATAKIIEFLLPTSPFLHPYGVYRGLKRVAWQLPRMETDASDNGFRKSIGRI